MAKLTFQRKTTKRILAVAPKLKFVAFYHRSEDRLNACMRDYGDRSFVYIFSSCYMDQEYFLYVGKSKAQYSRCLTHSKKYEYDHIYLFECDQEWLSESEKAVIKELTPSSTALTIQMLFESDSCWESIMIPSIIGRQSNATCIAISIIGGWAYLVLHCPWSCIPPLKKKLFRQAAAAEN